MKTRNRKEGKMSLAARALAMGMVAALVFVGMAGTGAAVTGLVGEWHFDGNAQDLSGNGNHGTIYGATFTEGIIGNALSFDGVSNYFTAPITASFNSVKTQGTIVAWINYKDNYLIYEPLCTYGSRALMLWRFGTYNIKSQASIDCAGRILSDWRIGSQTGSGISQSLKSGQWYHIALVYDSNAVILYINGQKVQSSSLTGELGDADDKFWIGRNGNAAQPMYFNGLIDDVRIYNRALTDSEIQANYNAVISPPLTTGTITVNTNLAGATFTLTGASSYSGSGTSWGPTTAPAGTYTITYGTVAGNNAPPSETKTLTAGGSIAFSGTYNITPTVTVTPTVTSTTVPPTTVPPTTVPPTTVPPTTVPPTPTPKQPLLTASHTTLKEEPEVGEEVLITVTVQNSGEGTAKNIRLTEQLPSSISVSYIDGATSNTGNLVTWNGELAPNRAHAITHTLKILEKKSRAIPVIIRYEDEQGNPKESSTTIYVSAQATATPTPVQTKEPTPYTPASTPRIPGFTGLLVLIGLIAAIGFVRRR